MLGAGRELDGGEAVRGADGLGRQDLAEAVAQKAVHAHLVHHRRLWGALHTSAHNIGQGDQSGRMVHLKPVFASASCPPGQESRTDPGIGSRLRQTRSASISIERHFPAEKTRIAMIDASGSLSDPKGRLHHDIDKAGLKQKKPSGR